MASSTTRPTASVSPSSEMLSRLYEQPPEQRDRADQRDRQRQRRDHGRDEAAQEQEDHQHHQRDRAEQRQRDVVQRLAHRDRAVVHRRHARPTAAAAPAMPAAPARTASTTRTVLASGWRSTASVIDGLAVEVGVGLDGLDAVLDRGDVLQAHRVAAAVADDQFGELGRIAQLAIGLQRQHLAAAVERADRRVDVGRAQRVATVRRGRCCARPARRAGRAPAPRSAWRRRC